MAATRDRFADRKPGWDTPLMIESHQNGVRTKAMNPNTPVTYEEVVEDPIRCWDAGASAIHDIRGKEAADDYMPAWSKILKARPDMIWYPTTCNNLLCTEDQTGREHVAYLHKDANVQVAVVDTGIDLFAVDLDEKRRTQVFELAIKCSDHPAEGEHHDKEGETPVRGAELD